MQQWVYDIVYPVDRWLHIVATTLLVGGTFFYELVVPVAISDLKEAQQLDVFAKARWVFRSVVRLSVVLFLISGGLALYRMWPTYTRQRPPGQPPTFLWTIIHLGPRDYTAAFFWSTFHVVLSVLAMMIALVLTNGSRPPARAIGWMRINLIIMLVAIFLASVTRHIRLSTVEQQRGVFTD